MSQQVTQIKNVLSAFIVTILVLCTEYKHTKDAVPEVYNKCMYRYLEYRYRVPSAVAVIQLGRRVSCYDVSNFHRQSWMNDSTKTFGAEITGKQPTQTKAKSPISLTKNNWRKYVRSTFITNSFTI